jgi:hypothetical protein
MVVCDSVDGGWGPPNAWPTLSLVSLSILLRGNSLWEQVGSDVFGLM